MLAQLGTQNKYEFLVVESYRVFNLNVCFTPWLEYGGFD